MWSTTWTMVVVSVKLRTLSEAAYELEISRSKLRAGLASGRYPGGIHVGSRWMVDVSEVRPVLEAEEAGHGISLSACARELGIPVSTLRRMALQGLVPCKRIGGKYSMDPDAVEAAIRWRMMEKK